MLDYQQHERFGVYYLRPTPKSMRFRRAFRLLRCPFVRLGSRGGLIVEAVVSITVFTMVGSAVLAGVSTTQIAGARVESQSIGENIARNQMEYIFSLPYQDPPSVYPTIEVPLGYSVTAAAEEKEPNVVAIAKIVVTVTLDDQVVLMVETYRTES